MKKKIVPAELTPSEREEVIRLRAENERLRAEIAVVKKRDCLERRESAQRNSRRKGCACPTNSDKEGHRLNDLLDAIRAVQVDILL